MKLNSRDIKKAVSVCVALLFLICIHVASVYVFAVHRFSMVYDPVFTAQACNDIDQYIEHEKLYKLRPDKLTKALQSAFPIVKSVRSEHRPDGMIMLMVQAAQPFVSIGKDCLITLDNYVVPSCYYDKAVTVFLPKIESSCDIQNGRLPEPVFSYIKKIDADLIKGSTIVWNHANEIKINVKNLQIQFVCNEQAVITKRLLDYCTTIAQELKTQSSSTQSILADVRFADQIIISKIKV
jgi:hypothetical protein